MPSAIRVTTKSERLAELEYAVPAPIRDPNAGYHAS